jgi:hypothetical protein
MPYYWITPKFWAVSGGGESNTAPWTHDVNIPPSSVYALASLNFYQQYGSNNAAIVGFLQYITQDPGTRMPSEHVTSAWGGDIHTGVEVGGWLAPCIDAENVIEITLAWNCYADDAMAAMGSFTIFLGLD